MFCVQINVMSSVDAVEQRADLADHVEFTTLLKGMLALDQNLRIGPAEALGHPFITLSHLMKDYPNTCL